MLQLSTALSYNIAFADLTRIGAVMLYPRSRLFQAAAKCLIIKMSWTDVSQWSTMYNCSQATAEFIKDSKLI